MTQTVDPVDAELESVMTEPVPRRRLVGRLSLGHLVMVLSGLLAFLLVLAVLRDNAATSFVGKASVDIAAGTTITGDDVELVEVTGDAFAGTVLNADQINAVITGGQVTTRALAAGTLLQQSDFAPAGFRSNVRSMSIPISPGRAVAGSLRSGDLVDVIATTREGLSWYVSVSTEVVEVADPSTGGFTSTDYTVTLAMGPETIIRAACAMEVATIDIVRSTGATPLEALPEPPDGVPESCR